MAGMTNLSFGLPPAQTGSFGGGPQMDIGWGGQGGGGAGQVVADATGGAIAGAYGDPTMGMGMPRGLGIRHVNAQGQMGGLNWGTLSNIGQMAGSLMGAWNAWQQQKLAKQAFAQQTQFQNINLNNTIKSYNTALEDRINSRYQLEGRSAEDAQSHIDRESLDRDAGRNGYR